MAEARTIAIEDHDRLTRDDLGVLLRERGGSRVSIYMSSDLVGHQTPQDAVRLKNLLNRAEGELVERGLRRPDAADLLKPGFDLLVEPLHWRTPGRGLALFLDEGAARRFRLPFPFDELLEVNERFHIEPLVRMLDGEHTYYVLALSQKRVRLLECSAAGVREVAPRGMPSGIEEALRYDEFEPQLRYHGGTGPNESPRGGQGRMFYGQGSTSDFAKKETQGFFRLVDAAVSEALKLSTAPMVLAGVEYELPLYREINSYPHLAEGAITNGPGLLSDDELRRRGGDTVEPLFEAARATALDRYHRLEGEASGQTSRRLAEIVPAAVFGRVDTLFIPSGQRLWGRFDPDTGEAQPHGERLPGDDDLYDVAASFTLLNRGTVYPLTPEIVPGGEAAAVFRY